MGWRFEILEETFREDELTLDQYERLEELLEVDWRSIHPIRSARQAKRIAALMYADRTGVTFDDALTKIGTAGAVAFVEELMLVDEPPDPPTGGNSTG